jgi:hypothetical protein
MKIANNKVPIPTVLVKASKDWTMRDAINTVNVLIALSQA